MPTWEISPTRLREKYEGQEDKIKQNNTLSIDNDMFRWSWHAEYRQDVMENTLKNVFHVDPDDQADYIELDDIVL